MATITRSSGLSCGPETQVFLGDSMGELTLLYAAADVAFVGGSLVQVGGHNLLEPAALGLPSITGPYNFNAPDIADLLMERGATTVARDAAGIAAEVLGLLADPAERRRRGQAALDALASNRGAVHRLLALVEPLAAPSAGG